MSKQHSILPASSCERWWNCPGSVNAIKDIPNPPNKYTAEGTVAHELAEELLRDPRGREDTSRLESLIGETKIQDGFEIEITEEMVDGVLAYRDYILDIWLSEGRPEIKLETRIELKEVNTVLFGTVDCVMVVPFKTIHIFDFKYGQGKRVSAYKNKQLMEYALGVMLKEDCYEAVIHICQPRVDDGFTSYHITADEIHEFEKELRVRAEAALSPKAPLVPGDWCKQSFCPARMSCPALHGLANELTKNDFALPAVVDTLSIEHIIKILKYEDTVKDWMAKVRDHAKELMIQGFDIPGYKVVQGLGHAKWVDEDMIIAEFEEEYGDKLYEKKLLSPAKFEKLAGKKALGPNFRDEYTVRPETGYKIVETEEKGTPIKTIKAQEDFQ